MDKIYLNKMLHITLFRECGKIGKWNTQYPNITRKGKRPHTA